MINMVINIINTVCFVSWNYHHYHHYHHYHQNIYCIKPKCQQNLMLEYHSDANIAFENNKDRSDNLTLIGPIRCVQF